MPPFDLLYPALMLFRHVKHPAHLPAPATKPTASSIFTRTFTPAPTETVQSASSITITRCRLRSTCDHPQHRRFAPRRHRTCSHAQPAKLDEGQRLLPDCADHPPSATLPAHSSMLTGVCPSKHGVDWNDFLPQNGIAQGTDLFDLAHAAGMRSMMYVGKEKLQQVTDESNINRFAFINDRTRLFCRICWQTSRWISACSSSTLPQQMIWGMYMAGFRRTTQRGLPRG